MPDEIKTLNIGLVMPIAPFDGCTADHWSEVKSIITEAVSTTPGYNCDTKLVSHGDSVGLIHKRIVHGLYNSDLVICDVSCKNPNVMFELGMRLAFDKPTVIIKDDKTDYSFDTGVIEHLEYPRDLRFTKITDFKSQLVKKVKATYEDSLSDPNHSPFLKSFGQFTVATLEETPISSEKLVLEMLSDLQSDVSSLKRQSHPNKKNIAMNNYLGSPHVKRSNDELHHIQNIIIKSVNDYIIVNDIEVPIELSNSELENLVWRVIDDITLASSDKNSYIPSKLEVSLFVKKILKGF